jgi:ribosomal protein L32
MNHIFPKWKQLKMMKTTKDSNTKNPSMDRYTMLSVSVCPDCGGDGIIVGVRIEPRCCGNLNEYGGCCNYPVPDQVAEPEQCEKCEATGIIYS